MARFRQAKKDEYGNVYRESVDPKNKQASDMLKNGGVIEEGSDFERERMNELKDKIRSSSYNVTEYVRERTEYKNKHGLNPHGVQKPNKMFNNVLMMQCIAPLRQGVSAGSIIECIGIYAGMALINKDFRDNAHALVQEKLYPYVQNYAENSKNPLIQRYAKRMTESGELPLTYDGAAVMEIGMMKSAYDEMRVPGRSREEVVEIQKTYSAAIDLLREQVVEDGLDLDEYDKHVKTIIGRVVEDHPEEATFVDDFVNYGVKPKPYEQRDVIVDGRVKTFDVWDGDFVYPNGEPHVGKFYARPPMNGDSCKEFLTGVYGTALYGAKTDEERFAIIDSFAGMVQPGNDFKFPDELPVELQDQFKQALNMSVDDITARGTFNVVKLVSEEVTTNYVKNSSDPKFGAKYKEHRRKMKEQQQAEKAYYEKAKTQSQNEQTYEQYEQPNNAKREQSAYDFESDILEADVTSVKKTYQNVDEDVIIDNEDQKDDEVSL